MTRIVLVVVLVTFPTAAAAQSQPAQVDPALPRVTSNSPVVWVTTADGLERKGRLVTFTSDRLIVQVDRVNQTLKTSEIVRVDTTDSIVNGVRNGAITGAALGGLFLAGAAGLGCEGDCSGGEIAVAGVFVVGFYTAIGAGLGGWIDHLIDGRRPIYTRASPPGLSISPILSAERRGARFRFVW